MEMYLVESVHIPHFPTSKSKLLGGAPKNYNFWIFQVSFVFCLTVATWIAKHVHLH